MIGSNWPEPLHAHSGTALLQVAPLSVLRSMAMYGVGQLPGHGFVAAYRVSIMYTKPPFGSAASAGSQSSAVASTSFSPAQPVAGAEVIWSGLPALPCSTASWKASARSAACSPCSPASGLPAPPDLPRKTSSDLRFVRGKPAAKIAMTTAMSATVATTNSGRDADMGGLLQAT